MKIIRKEDERPQALSRLEGERPFLSLRDAMNQLFNESFWDPFEGMHSFALAHPRQGCFPKVDVSETATEVKVSMNLPGVDPDKVEIEVSDDVLIISGKMEKESKEEDKETKFYRYEREYGEFHREFALPAAVQADKVTAKAKNGVLTIILPKAAKEQKKKIMVAEEK